MNTILVERSKNPLTTIAECYEVTGKGPLGIRWIDINKGDDLAEELRSRLVAKEIKRDKREDLFAATPPLEALKMLLSLAVTEGFGYSKGNRGGGDKIDFIDVRRAYFQAKARRDVYVELPEEDWEEGMCGKLVKSMYGTRDAAQNWEEEYTGFMEEIGFVKGLGSPCVFYHDDRKLRAVIHGDDFTISGKENQLNWFKENITNKFEVKFKARLGPEENDDKSVRVLNRVVEWNERGISYEPDQRHAEIIVRALTEINGTQRLSTPGRRTKREELKEDDEEELQGKTER